MSTTQQEPQTAILELLVQKAWKQLFSLIFFFRFWMFNFLKASPVETEWRPFSPKQTYHVFVKMTPYYIIIFFFSFLSKLWSYNPTRLQSFLTDKKKGYFVGFFFFFISSASVQLKTVQNFSFLLRLVERWACACYSFNPDGKYSSPFQTAD